MKYKGKKLIALLTSAIILGSPMQLGAVVSAKQDEAVSESRQTIEVDTDHAYDPIKDIVKQQQQRENTAYVENKVIFSVLDKRKDDSVPVRLTDKSTLCLENGLKKVSLIYESVAADSAQTPGFTPYEVFYEAYTEENDPWNTVDKLLESEEVISAEPDVLWEKSAVGTYKEVTKEELENETHFEELDIPAVWKRCENENTVPGNNVVVAVIDTGVDYKHKELADSMWINSGEIPGNGIDDDENGYIDDVYGYDFVENDGNPMDDNGHGTHVAGIIAMQPGNGGGVGIAYGAKIMAIKAGQSTGFFASTDIVKAIQYAMANGADVINMSFGGKAVSYLVQAALKDAFSCCVLVASAGNDGAATTDANGIYPTEDFYPAGFSYVIGVMATDENGIAEYSNWDFKIGANCEYEVAAPGTEIYSTLPNDRYARWSGTSMAAPVVSSAAAILRSLFPDKNKYTSRYIMGQLVAATEKKTEKNYFNILKREYPFLCIEDSIDRSPHPDLYMKDFYIIDSPEVSPVNNGDGIAQPGETLDIGISIFNRWGVASDITVTAKSESIAGIPNPYIEYITDTINLNDTGTFATTDNGWIYNDNAVTGFSNPIRVKVKETAPNDVFVPFDFTITSHNGLDSQDTTTYVMSIKGYETIIQRGHTLSGVINEDMVLTPDEYWIIENNVLIPEGVTVRVEPGTQIQFWSADPSNPYGEYADVFIQVEGRFIAEGTEEAPIKMFPGKGYEGATINFSGAQYGSNSKTPYTLDEDNDNDYISLKYVNIVNAGSTIHSNNCSLDHSFTVTEIDHCKFIYSTSQYETHIYALSVTNSEFHDLRGYAYTPWLTASRLNENLFDNCCIELNGEGANFDHPIESISDNVFINCTNDGQGWLYRTNYGSNTVFEHNAFLPDFNHNRISDIQIIRSGSYAISRHDMEMLNNYWGSTNPKLIKAQCFDADWNVSCGDIIQEPFLTENDDMSSIYPFVVDAYLTDPDGTRLDTVSGTQNVQMHIVFNRDMAQDIQPMVTFGGVYPYTDYTVNGNWISAREWVSGFTIDPFINMGRMYICIKNAAADDDHWLVTGNDMGRFFFKVDKNQAQSMALKVSAHEGYNELSWDQDDYNLLAGYNLYRGEEYDPDKPIAEQEFEKINPIMVSGDECEFKDTGANQGKPYYYYFTVVDTGLVESPPSNVVRCTTLDTIAPTITFDPVVTTVIKNEQTRIKVFIQDNVRITDAVLHYKNQDETEWKHTGMNPVYEQNGPEYNSYIGIISAYEITDKPIMYYITAEDGVNTGYFGSESEPIIAKSQTEHNWDKDNCRYLSLPSCTEDGIIEYSCLDCNEVHRESVPKRGHEYDSGICKKGDICTEEHIMEYTCYFCGEKYEAAEKAKGHQYESHIVEPTCHSQGYTEYICTQCGNTYRDNYTPKTEHNYYSEEITPVSCQGDGMTRYTCSVCGDSFISIQPHTGHNIYAYAVAPTCTHMGYTVHTCENCGYQYTDNYVKASDHYYNDGEIIKEPTVLETGLKRYTCIDCHSTRTEVLPKLTAPALVNESVISSESVTAGTKVTLTGKASGGTGEYTYALMFKKQSSSTWTKIGQKYGTVNVGSFTPKTVTKYDIMINVKDSSGKIKTKSFVLTVKPASAKLVNTSSLSTIEIENGNKVYLYGNAEGGSGEYLYAMLIKKQSNTEWVKVGVKYGTAAVRSFTPKSATTYDVMINVKDGNGTIKSKKFVLVVK